MINVPTVDKFFQPAINSAYDRAERTINKLFMKYHDFEEHEITFTRHFPQVKDNKAGAVTASFAVTGKAHHICFGVEYKATYTPSEKLVEVSDMVICRIEEIDG